MAYPCKYPACPALLARSGYCERHQKDKPNTRAEYDARRKRDPILARSAAIRSTGRWKKVQRLKLGMNPLCEDPFREHARRNMTEIAKQVHHIEGLAVAPEKAFDLENLMSVCTRCHARLERDERSKHVENQ
jgi:5-methylcytosine-specific restriction endonuclease McrA